jgi:hypothetical protein
MLGLEKSALGLNIPLPQNGHWQKVQYGKKVAPKTLPVSNAKEQEITLMIRDNNDIGKTNDQSPLKTLQLEIEQQLKSELIVPEKLSNPHQLIITAKESLNEKDRYVQNGLVSCKQGQLDIKISKAGISRVLRFMDTFIKALHARNHTINVNSNGTYLEINQQKIKISVREKNKTITKRRKK